MAIRSTKRSRHRLGQPATSADARPSRTLHLLAVNPGKRRCEIVYLTWFLLSVPLQWLIVIHLRYDRPNDPALVGQALVMGAGTLVWPLVFRAPEDRARPVRDLYGFRMGVFLTIWAVLGGFIGTDPWYEVLHGHFAFNTAWNPNGAVSGFATLGILMVLMAVTKTFIAPHYVDVQHGIRHLNDWSTDNCLGPKP
ncbi:hypothetical protein ACAG26_15105 [Mycobacterium sp. pUA109]|uniref:hypothetical protein n=1 Tax=Mycobacterium sp. pUA109 TaxID=3238982 RepID=UPI00351AC9AC